MSKTINKSEAIKKHAVKTKTSKQQSDADMDQLFQMLAEGGAFADQSEEDAA